MVLLIAIVGILLAVAFIAYWWGAWKLAQYGFRISTGTGLAVLLVPPYTAMFAWKLQESGKEGPMAGWFFGIISAVILIGMFFQPLSMAATGRMGEIIAAEKKAEQEALDAQKKANPEKSVEVKVKKVEEVKPVEAPKVEPTTDTPSTDTPTAKVTPGTDAPAPKADAKPVEKKADTSAPKVDAKPVEKKADAPK